MARRQSIATTLAAVSLVAAVGATSALGAGLRTGEKTTLIPGTASLGGVASCPSGRAVSGGFNEPGHAGSASFAESLVYSSFRPSRKSWSSSAFNAGTMTSTWQTFVYCSKENGLKSLKSATASAPNAGFGSTTTVTAECPSQYKVVSGGFDTTGVGGNLVGTARSLKSGSRSWTATVRESGSPGTVTATAYCRKGGKGLKTRQGTATAGATNPLFLATATAECKPGERVLSGGFDGPGFDPGLLGPGAFAYESEKVGKRSWRVSLDNFGGAPAPVVAYAYCEKA